jgi:hypothetical protein
MWGFAECEQMAQVMPDRAIPATAETNPNINRAPTICIGDAQPRQTVRIRWKSIVGALSSGETA